MGYFDGYGFPRYVPVAERRRKAERALKKLSKKGQVAAPVVIAGRTIAHTFWGKAWCDNLEGYSDFSNRLPRGRTYVRNGSVVDLHIAPGEVRALVSGSSLYKVAVTVAAVPKAHWAAICADCTGAIDSLVELLQGRFSKGVMERICQQTRGLFPAPREIQFTCSCPDWAAMCKHVAAVLYGVGARLDEQPELLFQLRAVDPQELIAQVGSGLPLAGQGPAGGKVLAGDDLAALFGLELGDGAPEPVVEPPPRTRRTATAGASKAATGSAARPAARPRPGPKAAAVAQPSAKAAAKPKPGPKAAAKPRPGRKAAAVAQPSAKAAAKPKSKPGPKAAAVVKPAARKPARLAEPETPRPGSRPAKKR